jgi:hypothetical protein
MTDQKMDDEKLGEGLMDEHPFYRNRKLKIFILLLTITVFILPIFIIANMIMGKPAFFFF